MKIEESEQMQRTSFSLKQFSEGTQNIAMKISMPSFCERVKWLISLDFDVILADYQAVCFTEAINFVRADSQPRIMIKQLREDKSNCCKKTTGEIPEELFIFNIFQENNQIKRKLNKKIVS